LISFPTGTEMFQFPALAPFRVPHEAVGCPIRKSPDHSVLARSPKLIAGSCVLHRLLLPRHPSCALCSLNHQCVRSHFSYTPSGAQEDRHGVYPIPICDFNEHPRRARPRRTRLTSVAEEQVESMNRAVDRLPEVHQEPKLEVSLVGRNRQM
jgi:hypothetical protein